MESSSNIRVEAEQQSIRMTWWTLLGNAFLFLVKLFIGVLGHSYALIADAIESASDICSSVLVLFGLKYAAKPADDDHPYGHGRAEPLLTFVVVGFLVASSVLIFYLNFRQLHETREMPASYTLYILGGIILTKEFFYRLMLYQSKQTKSTLLEADAWHHRSDAITSLTAFVGISIALFMGTGYEHADNYAALIAAVVILYNAYRIFRPALGEIMDEHVHDDLVDEIRRVSTQVKGVLDTEKCLVRKTGLRYHVDLHITVFGGLTVKEGHDISHDLKDTLLREIPQIMDVLVHVEPDSIAQPQR